jgi:hypothetical protein
VSPPLTQATGLAIIYRTRIFWLLSIICAFSSFPETTHAGELSIKSLSRLVGVGIASGLGASRVFLGDELSISSDVSQDIDVSDNISLLADPPGGGSVSWTTGVTGAVMTRHRTREFEVRARMTRVDVEGPGDPGNLDADWGDDMFYSTRFHKQRKRFTYNMRASQSLQNAAAAQARDSTIPTFDDQDTTGGGLQGEGLTGVDALQETFTVGGDVTAEVNQRNSLTLSAEAVQQTFTGDRTGGLEDSESITTSAAWTVRTSQLTDLTAEVSHNRFKTGDGGKSRILKPRAILNSQVSDKLSATLDAGADFVSAEAGSTGVSPGTGTTGQNASDDRSGSAVGFIGRFNLEYALKRTSVSFDVSRDVSPTSTGDLNLVEQAGIQISHSINRRSEIGVSARYSKQTSPSGRSQSGGPPQGVDGPPQGSTRTLYTITPSYSITLNRKWTANMEYEFAFQDRSIATGAATPNSLAATSNGVFVNFRRSLPAGR